MKNLSLADWASVAEVVGAAAVVASLIYVGVQVRDNTEAVLAANRQEMVGRAHYATISVATTPVLAESFAKSADNQELTNAEKNQYRFFVRAMLYDVQESYLLHREGRLDDGYWMTRDAVFKAYMQQQFAREIYKRDKSLSLLHSDFALWADVVIEELP